MLTEKEVIKKEPCMSRNSLAVKSLIPLTIACGAFALGIIAFAQQPAQPEGKGKAEKTKKKLPPLFFREDWQETKGVPVEHPVTQAAVATPTLDIKLYGPSGKDIVENGLPNNADNPPHLWTGLCTSTCAAALRDRNNYVDLTGMAKIRWLIHTSGFHEVRPLVKLADGTWLVGDHGDATTQDYHVVEITLADLRWLKMDMEKVVTRGDLLDRVDLSKVDEVGFTDLMPGSGHGDGGYSGVGWIEVYGKPIKRD
jgi:hypothetical protein